MKKEKSKSLEIIEEVTVEPVVEPVEEPIVEPVEEPKDEETKDENIKGAKLVKCTKLNVRKEANKNADVVCIINEKSVITVNVEESTEDFYKVYTSDKEVLIEGYCMKEFISIN